MNLFAVHEWNPNHQGWAKGLDAMLPVVLSREMQDNQNKFSRWTIMSLLGDVNKMRMGFVQRYKENQTDDYRIVGTHMLDTKSFAQ
jgi:translation initiation factor 3 subunit D